jgi:hypothetical protein
MYMFHPHVITFLSSDKQFSAEECFDVVIEVQCYSSGRETWGKETIGETQT